MGASLPSLTASCPDIRSMLRANPGPSHPDIWFGNIDLAHISLHLLMSESVTDFQKNNGLAAPLWNSF